MTCCQKSRVWFLLRLHGPASLLLALVIVWPSDWQGQCGTLNWSLSGWFEDSQSRRDHVFQLQSPLDQLKATQNSILRKNSTAVNLKYPISQWPVNSQGENVTLLDSRAPIFYTWEEKMCPCYKLNFCCLKNIGLVLKEVVLLSLTSCQL